MKAPESMIQSPYTVALCHLLCIRWLTWSPADFPQVLGHICQSHPDSSHILGHFTWQYRCVWTTRKRRQRSQVISQWSIQLMGAASISAHQLQEAQFKCCNVLTALRLDEWRAWILLGGCWRPGEVLLNIYNGIKLLCWRREFNTAKQRCPKVGVYKRAKCTERRSVPHEGTEGHFRCSRAPQTQCGLADLSPQQAWL